MFFNISKALSIKFQCKKIMHVKVLLFMYKSLNSLAPAYLTDKIKWLQPSKSLRSCDGYKAIVPRAYKVRLGDRAFSIIGPKL